MNVVPTSGPSASKSGPAMRLKWRSTAAASITSTSCSRLGIAQYPKRSVCHSPSCPPSLRPRRRAALPGASRRHSSAGTAAASGSFDHRFTTPPALRQPAFTGVPLATRTENAAMSW